MSKAIYDDIDPIDSLLAEAARDPNRRYHFYRALSGLELVVLGSAAADGEDQDGGIELLLKYIEMDGELVLPVFSSTAKFEAIFQDHYSYVKIAAQDLWPLIEQGASLVLNPGFDQAKKIIPEEIETLQDGSILQYFFNQMSPEAKEEFLTDQVVEVPDTTLSSMTDCLRTFPSIKKAYLTSMFDPISGSKPRPLVVLDAEGLNREEPDDLLLSVVDVVKDKVSAQIKFEFVILDEDIPLTISTAQQVNPFYERKPKDDLTSMFR